MSSKWPEWDFHQDLSTNEPEKPHVMETEKGKKGEGEDTMCSFQPGICAAIATNIF